MEFVPDFPAIPIRGNRPCIIVRGNRVECLGGTGSGTVQTLTPGYIHTFRVSDYARRPVALSILLYFLKFWTRKRQNMPLISAFSTGFPAKITLTAMAG